MKLLGIHLSYNLKLKAEKVFYDMITNIQRVLKQWISRNLIVKEKIVIFKATAFSKIIFQALIITLPNHIIK